MSHFRLLPEAVIDLQEAAEWYEAQELGLGQELLDEFEHRLNTAIEVPSAGQLSSTTIAGNVIRRYQLDRFHRYAILMAVVECIPTIVAFAHSRRRPKFWDERV
ncbi:MAG: hypothetical protein JKY56_00640, partial [Kofleriaceae bacterium]|nr:hypothetical protein [Kofleriaceae bacterium]